MTHPQSPPVPIAMLADPHFHDVFYASPATEGDPETVRSFRDSISAARTLNESYFSLRAALDKVVSLGIKLVVMPGDLTEDGQPCDIAGFLDLLNHYRTEHGIMIFATFGNHDAYGPTGRNHAKSYTSEQGERFVVAGHSNGQCRTDPNMLGLGYAALMQRLKSLGFFRQPDYLHWETPFGTHDALASRTYELRSEDGANSVAAIDASYLVEPVKDIWLLALDSNVYLPKNGPIDPSQADAYIDSKDGKWDAVVKHRPYLLDWMADVRRRADAMGKALVVFSHYPVVAASAGKPNEPAPATTEAIARTGIRLHFSGHEHVCQVIRHHGPTHHLTDVALPAVCSFPPAFRHLLVTPAAVEIGTVIVDKAPGFDTLFPRYAAEAQQDAALVNAAGSLLQATDFGDFISRQLAAAVQNVLGERQFGPRFMQFARTATLADCAVKLTKNSAPAQPNSRSTVHLSEAIADWYRLSRAGQAALAYVPPDRRSAYIELASRIEPAPANEGTLSGDLRCFLTALADLAANPFPSAFTEALV